MKSRWTTGLLLAAVVAVWGVVAWKILVRKPDAAPQTTSIQQPAAITPNADTLTLDYADPFLKSVAGQRSKAEQTVVRTLPRTQYSIREAVEIIHQGTISTAGQRLYILTIGEEQYELERGEAADDFTLLKADRDSLYLRKAGLTYGVKLCE